MVSTRAALLYGPGQDYKIETIEIDDPRAGEVLIQMKACGLCHSDEHARTGDMPMPHYPIICGHEGAGEVRRDRARRHQRRARRPRRDVVRPVLRPVQVLPHEQGVPLRHSAPSCSTSA